jgi:hypothetical protein
VTETEGEAITKALAKVPPFRLGEDPMKWCKRWAFPAIRSASEAWWRAADAEFRASLRPAP